MLTVTEGEDLGEVIAAAYTVLTTESSVGDFFSFCMIKKVLELRFEGIGGVRYFVVRMSMMCTTSIVA